MDIPGVSSINGSIALLGKLAGLVQNGATIELRSVIQELKESLLNEKDENLQLREEVSRLSKLLDTRNNMVFSDPVYYRVELDGTKSGPYCQCCFDKDVKQVRLVHNHGESWNCSVCKNYFETRAHKESQNTAWHASSRNDYDPFV